MVKLSAKENNEFKERGASSTAYPRHLRQSPIFHPKTSPLNIFLQLLQKKYFSKPKELTEKWKRKGKLMERWGSMGTLHLTGRKSIITPTTEQWESLQSKC